MKIEVLRAKECDLKWIVEEQKRAFYECYQRYQDHEMSPYNVTVEMMRNVLENEYLYKVTCNGDSVGAVYVCENPDCYNMKLHGIFISPEHQDLGIGRVVIEQIEKLHSEAVTWVLETPHDLMRNHHLYEKMGYQKTGKVDVVNENLKIVHYRKKVCSKSRGA